MAHAATPDVLNSASLAREPVAKNARRGVLVTLLAACSAVRSGIAASQHYEALRARGVNHPEAIDRAFAELGFGS